jgi:hypothetical protein
MMAIMSPMVPAAAGVPRPADPLWLTHGMAVAGQRTNPLARERAARGAERAARTSQLIEGR